MRNQIDIDAAFSRAIIREIGERLRASVRENELPARLRVLLDRLDQLDDHSSPSGVPELESEKFDGGISGIVSNKSDAIC